MGLESVRYGLAAVAALMILGGCERIFEDPGSPQIRIVSPDLSVDQLDPVITLRVGAASDYASITRVLLDTTEMTFDRAEGLWIAPVTLHDGLNQLVITSQSDVFEAAVDTFYALHMPYNVTAFPGSLNPPVGGHSATLTPTGTLYVIGGSSTPTGPAVADGQMLRDQAASFTGMPAQLNTARVGHTTTLLQDGRLLIAGGGRRGRVTSVEQLVSSVEIYSEESELFVEVPVTGDPIRRMNHTASLRITSEGPVLDLVGGTGDVQYTPEPLLGVRNDLRSFLLRNDSLFALSPAVGPFLEAVSGHTQTPFENLPTGTPGAFLLTGYVTNPSVEPASYVLDFASPFGITLDQIRRSDLPRLDHAAERLQRNVIGLFGGTEYGSNAPVGTAEVFIWPVKQYFALPFDPSNRLFNRYGHTATIVGPNRILVIGGFNQQEAAIEQTLIFNYSL